MAETQGVFFGERFLDRHAGVIISDPAVAIVELVANAWDAWATKVEIEWSERDAPRPFSIVDDGKGMTEAELQRRWGTLDYNKQAEEGPISAPPPERAEFAARRAYGRNGRGRHAAFRFGDAYTVRTWRDGQQVTFAVRRGRTSDKPFELEHVSTVAVGPGHGTEIAVGDSGGVNMSAQEARETLGTRFLSDPNFSVYVNGTPVTFADVPADRLSDVAVEVPGFGIAKLIIIDAQRADRTTRQHGIAWWVASRLVGTVGWGGFDLDGRTSEAKRFLFIVEADFLADEGAVTADWIAFDVSNPAWIATREAVYDRMRLFLTSVSTSRRQETKDAVYERFGRELSRLPPIGRDRWTEFVDQVVDSCPSITTEEVQQVAGILAKLELATSKYGLIQKLHDMDAGEIDQWNTLLSDWSVRTAKLALDEIQSRLKLIEELDYKLRDERLDEVADLQPLLERSLWVFGPEFESLEYTSNRGMTEVIERLLGGTGLRGSRNRPDFVMVPDGSVGFYSRDAHDDTHEVNGVAHLVVAEIKKVGVEIGPIEKAQPWKYVSELIKMGLVTESTRVDCFVLGSKVAHTEEGVDKRWSDRVTIKPLAYNVFVKRAEMRMLGLRQKLQDAPFLRDLGLDASAYITPVQLPQAELDLPETA